MDSVLKEILEIERSAKEIVNKATQEQNRYALTLESVKEEMRERYFERAKKRIEILTEEEDRLFNEKVVNIQDRHMTAMKKINDMYDSNLNAWVDDIFARLTSID